MAVIEEHEVAYLSSRERPCPSERRLTRETPYKFWPGRPVPQAELSELAVARVRSVITRDFVWHDHVEIKDRVASISVVS